MATKQVLETTPNPTQAKGTKAKTKAKPKARKPAEAPDTKTKTKTTARIPPGSRPRRPRRKPAEAAATKAKGTGRKLMPAAETKTSRRRPADQLEIHDHDSLSSARVLDRDQSLDGGSALPGFQLPLKELLTAHIK